MKLLIIVSSLSNGGAQRVASNLIMGLPEECEVDILLNDASDVSYPYKGNIIDLGMPHEDDKGKLSYQIRVFFRRLSKLCKLKKTGNYNAAISFLDSANVANIITGKRYTKVITTVHSKLSASGFDWKYKYIVFPLVRLFYGHADNVVAVSKGVEQDLREQIHYKGHNLVTRYNGFDFNEIKTMSKEQLTDDENKMFDNHTVLISVGRLTKAKGYWHLIRAMQLIIRDIPDVLLLILGAGEQEQYLKKLCEDLNLQDRVVFKGAVDNPFKYMARADLFVMSSIFEGLPSSLIEALVLGTPCVATDFKSGAREVLAPELPLEGELLGNIYQAEYGIISPICSEKECSAAESLQIEEQYLANAIIQALSGENVVHACEQKANEAVGKFSIEAMVDGYLNLI